MSTAAQKAKDKGNAAFRAENYPEAVGHYTEAILANGTDPTYPLNRAAAYLRLGKAVDAERDCSTALRLSPGHVKALYRRAQARIELGKLNEAKSDLSDALKRESGNSAVKSELQRVEKLLTEGPKTTPPPTDIGKAVKPVPPNRRRVPIEIIEGDVSSSNDIESNEMLMPISSRSLQPDTEVPLPTPLPSPDGEPSQTKPVSPAPPESQDSTKSTKSPPSVRGGIFRPSGQHTLFRSPESSRPDSQPSTIRSNLPFTENDDTPQPSSLSLFDFARTWELASLTERWDLLCRVPPQSLPALFKTSLEAALLAQILETCSLAVESTNDPTIKERVHGYLRWLQRVPRFSIVSLFLSKQEKEIGRTLGQTVGCSEWKL
ncbi:hypothetical protein ACEPAF_9728 [Sanghuangporus sanghuang]